MAQTQNHDFFISPKRKKTILEMALKSFDTSKLNYQMSNSWKKSAAHKLESTSKFDLLKNWVHDCSAQGRIWAKSTQDHHTLLAPLSAVYNQERVAMACVHNKQMNSKNRPDRLYLSCITCLFTKDWGDKVLEVIKFP